MVGFKNIEIKNFRFEFSMFPNNKDANVLENLIENIINPYNLPIMDCW